MFQLDDKFLDDLGLSSLPEEQKRAFLQHIYDELELRVGTRLSEGLSEEQLKEFEAIIDHKEAEVNAWIEQHVPDFATDPAYSNLVQAIGLPADSIDVKAEYVATKWLEVNRPDYRDVVASTLNELKAEITANRSTILGDDAPQAPAA